MSRNRQKHDKYCQEVRYKVPEVTNICSNLSEEGGKFLASISIDIPKVDHFEFSVKGESKDTALKKVKELTIDTLTKHLELEEQIKNLGYRVKKEV